MPINRLCVERAACTGLHGHLPNTILAKCFRLSAKKRATLGSFIKPPPIKRALLDGVLCIAAANNSLGNALLVIGERENSIASLKEAASAYRAAFEAQPENAAPLDMARTQ